MEDFEGIDDKLDYLMQEGALEIVGIDSETGNFLYSFTEKLAELDPIMHRMMMDSYYESITNLWQLGFLSMDITTDNPLVSATEKVFDREAVEKLSPVDRQALSDILKKMSE
jgi:hypothetical protein